MAASGYTPWSVVVGEQPTTTKWNLLGSNDASFYSGNGINDQAIVWRHLQADMVPTGAIYIWGTSTAPSANWLICSGQAISRTTYAALYAVIGVTYGTGDGSTTFNLPNLGGRVPVGKTAGDSNFLALGQTGGEDSHILTVGEMPIHNHTGGTTTDGNHNHTVGTLGTSGSYGIKDGAASSSGTGFTSSNGNHSHTFTTNNTGGGSAHNVLQPYITVNFIIKI